MVHLHVGLVITFNLVHSVDLVIFFAAATAAERPPYTCCLFVHLLVHFCTSCVIFLRRSFVDVLVDQRSYFHSVMASRSQ